MSTGNQDLISPEMSVADLLDRWPEVIPLFMQKRISCVGCSMASFDSLYDVARIYQLSLPIFLEEISRSIESLPSNRG